MRFILAILAALVFAATANAAPNATSACKLGRLTLAIARVPGGEPVRVTDPALLDVVGQWVNAAPVYGGANFHALHRYVTVTLFRDDREFAGLIRVNDEDERLRVWVRTGDKGPTICASGVLDRASVDAWIDAVQGSA